MKRNDIYAFAETADYNIHIDNISADPNTDSDIQSLVINYKTFLMGRCRKLTHGNLHDANDLFSRVMLKVCSESPQQLRQVRHMGGWLSRIAYNQFIDDQRERQADARRDGGLSYLSETIGLSALSAEQEYLNAELSHQLGLAFEALPERLRRAAYMRFCEDAPYDRIAADLAITPANARKHIQEARRLLGARVRRYVGNELLPQRAPGRSATLSLLHYAE